MMTAVISVIDSKIKESWQTKYGIPFSLKMTENTEVWDHALLVNCERQVYSDSKGNVGNLRHASEEKFPAFCVLRVQARSSIHKLLLKIWWGNPSCKKGLLIAVVHLQFIKKMLMYVEGGQITLKLTGLVQILWFIWYLSYQFMSLLVWRSTQFCISFLF